MTTISIILTSYNHGKYISQAIKTVLEQDFKDFELLILDDQSTDNSVEIIKGFNDSRIKLISNEQNLGMVRNINQDIKLAT
jgi:glycosyltransferase involved in cell wall biosynthesis